MSKVGTRKQKSVTISDKILYFQFLLLFLLTCSISSLPQQTFLAPLNDANVAASQVIFSFRTQQHNFYDKIHGEKLISSPSEVIKNFASPGEEFVFSPSGSFHDYGVSDGVLSSSPSEIITDYVYPEKKFSSSSSEAVSDINEFRRSDLAYFEPIIDPNHDADDTINHEDTREVVDNVMRGSYAYVGSDGLPYMIDWYADDDGFHPFAPHLSNYGEPVIDESNDEIAAQLSSSAVASVGNVDFPISDILNDESSFDELFSISGNDLPAYGDEVAASQLLDNASS